MTVSLFEKTKDILNKIYNLDNEKPQKLSNCDYYKFPIDDRANLFLNTFFVVDKRKLDQIKSIDYLEKAILSGNIPCDIEDIKIAFGSSKIIFFYGCSIKIHILMDKEFDDVKISMFGQYFKINEWVDGSAYEKCYKSKLFDLKREFDPRSNLIGDSYQEYVNRFFKTADAIIKSKIPVDNFNFISYSEFNDTYSVSCKEDDNNAYIVLI